ncbi:uncharacterized protein LODBEIA_P44520 [Lodderomyces beijingensis]|uniref:Beta-mannosyltransferase 1 n=1 Tax=Lodderomyces beijingensis TaxID=1775926 RepID=A0ABP0ZPZ3_9ASCO
MRRNSRIFLILLSFTFALLLIVFGFDSYKKPPQYHKLPRINYHHNGKNVIFPASFQQGDVKVFYLDKLGESPSPHDSIFKNPIKGLHIPDVEYHSHQVQIYESARAIDSGGRVCQETSRTINVQVSDVENRNIDLYRVLTKFMRENGDYYRELKDLLPDLAEQLRLKTVHKYWFQLIGSSVWLEQYGVHLMTTRIFYTPFESKVKPVFSFIYVQVFDQHWQELDNVELVIPTAENESGFKIVRYPGFAPVPAYHNYKQQSGRFYGAEDQRLVLVHNSMGFAEPVIVYNSHHRKVVKTKMKNDWSSTSQMKSYRGIFVGWLWRTQTGKNNVDELDQEHKDKTYIKVKELLLPSGRREKKEKNWTPFVNFKERQLLGYDSNLYFVYQFQDLRILKCSLAEEDEKCEWEYEVRNVVSISEFRGGTELMSVSQFVAENPQVGALQGLRDQLEGEDSEMWIGFARTALKGCGCGVKFYRPNLIVLLKVGTEYIISHTSTSITFDVPVISWDGSDQLCRGKNLIMPNGISSWQIDKETNDVLTLTLSRADTTVDFIYVKGLVHELFGNLNRKLADYNSEIVFESELVHCAIAGAFKACESYSMDKDYSDAGDAEEFIDEI